MLKKSIFILITCFYFAGYSYSQTIYDTEAYINCKAFGDKKIFSVSTYGKVKIQYPMVPAIGADTYIFELKDVDFCLNNSENKIIIKCNNCILYYRLAGKNEWGKTYISEMQIPAQNSLDTEIAKKVIKALEHLKKCTIKNDELF